MGRYADNLKKMSETAAQAATDQAQSDAIAAILTQGTGAPSAKPAAKNLLYFNTTAKKLYVSTGTTATSDWEEVKASDPA